jgi:hypothetical protein
LVHTLQPLSDASWVKIKKQIKEDKDAKTEPDAAPVPGSYPDTDPETEVETASAQSANNAAEGVVVEAHREVRVKLYIGQVCCSTATRPW